MWGTSIIFFNKKIWGQHLYTMSVFTNVTVQSTLTSGRLVKRGGVSTEFLKADGSIDSTAYLSGSYVPLSGGTLTGDLTGTTITGTSLVKSGGLPTQFLKADGSTDSSVYLTQLSAGTIYLPLAGGTLSGALTGAAITGSSFAKTGGVSTEFLKADGSTDSTAYLTQVSAGTTYLPLAGGTLSGDLTGTTITGSSFIKTGGVSTEFLKADGTTDSSVYLTQLSAGTTYLPLAGGTLSGALTGAAITGTSFTKTGGTVSEYLMADGSVTTSTGAFLPLAGGNMVGAINSLGVLQVGTASTTGLTLGRVAVPTSINGTDIAVAATGQVNINSALTGSNAILIGNTTTGAIQLGSITASETKVTGVSVLVDGTTVAIGTGSSTGSTTVGKTGVATSIRGTVNISGVYTLPVTAPALYQVLGCNILGGASWTTAVRSGYAFNPISRGTTTIATGNKSYWFTCLLTEPILVSGCQVYVSSGSGDNARVGIYRGFMRSGLAGSIPLVGQSVSSSLATGIAAFNRLAITATVGQSLLFAAGDYMTIAFHSSGSTNVYVASPISTGGLVEISYNSAANYTTVGFPTTIAQATVSTVNNNRPCFELY